MQIMTEDEKFNEIFRLLETGLTKLEQGFNEIVSEIERINIRLERLENPIVESFNG